MSEKFIKKICIKVKDTKIILKQMAEKILEKIVDSICILRFRVRQSLTNTDGIGVVEVILILVVLIGLVIIFKSELNDLVNKIFEKITKESSKI